eukprot:TRINITY_DN49726_c0_g1_i1.p1 TRINITY_DN49726_c0_g1~~TRINITY_DN49726_c0_g1_i1.p1  ORF type:complete len:507 (-),score=108.99 TRINITY_DN49726_c0_g1_i1:92-1516(-)
MAQEFEDVQPSDWFREKVQAFQREFQQWRERHPDCRDFSKKALSNPMSKAASVAKPEPRPSEPSPKKARLGDKDEKDKPTDAEKEDNGEGEGESKEPMDPLQALEDKVDAQAAEVLDVFGVDDVMDVGTGQPLFAHFAIEDWALLSLRFELHILVHAIARDCTNKEVSGMTVEQLGFVYQKYFKRPLIAKNYGFDSLDELLNLVCDTVIPVGETAKILESQLMGELECNEIFVKLTEESRRDRQRRIDDGDEGAQLKLTAANAAVLKAQWAVSFHMRTAVDSPGIQPMMRQALPSGPPGRPGDYVQNGPSPLKPLLGGRGYLGGPRMPPFGDRGPRPAGFVQGLAEVKSASLQLLRPQAATQPQQGPFAHSWMQPQTRPAFPLSSGDSQWVQQKSGGRPPIVPGKNGSNNGLGVMPALDRPQFKGPEYAKSSAKTVSAVAATNATPKFSLGGNSFQVPRGGHAPSWRASSPRGW